MATLRIDQVGLPAGIDDKSRSDGLNNGATVTLTSVGPGITHTFTLLWVPTDDNTAVSSFSQVGNTATFSPDPTSKGGTYRIRLQVTDVNGTTETIRLFAIRNSAGLRIPALNEQADETASLDNNGPAQIAASEMNEDAASGPFAGGNYGGWYSAQEELYKYVEDHKASHIQGGSDELDGDQVDIDFTPANYTPSTAPTEVTDVDQLSAHLAGIDDALGAVSASGSPGLEGLPYANMVLLLDAQDRSSYAGSGTVFTDLINNVNGTLNSISLTNGHLRFAGTSGSYLSFSSKPAGTTDIFAGGGTVSFWYRNVSTSGTTRLVSTAPGFSLGWAIEVDNSLDSGHRLSFTQFFSGNDGVWSVDKYPQDNEFYLVTITYDNSSTSNDPAVYINGKLVSVTETTTPSGSFSSDSTYGINFGADTSSTSLFNGDLDFVTFHDRILSSTEIEQVYESTAYRYREDHRDHIQQLVLPPGIPTSNLIFTMDSALRSSYIGSGSTVYDVVGNVAGSLSNVTFSDGSFLCNGINSTIDFAEQTPEVANMFTGGGSLCFWIKPNSGSSGTILSRRYSIFGDIVVTVTSPSTYTTKLQLDAATTGISPIWEIDIARQAWQFVVINFNSSVAITTPPGMYVNGESVTPTLTNSPTGGFVFFPTNLLLLGSEVPNSSSFDGNIGAVYMYESSLSSEEVALLYKSTRDRYNTTEYNESITTETVTGTDTTLTAVLSTWPASPSKVRLYLNGVLLRQGAGQDYEILNGRQINWLAATGTAPDLDTTDELLAVYEG